MFTPIEDGEAMPLDRYTEIYMVEGGKVAMEQSGMGEYEAVSIWQQNNSEISDLSYADLSVVEI